MVIFSVHFKIPGFARRLFFHDKDGKVDLRRIEAFYDKKTLDELKSFPGLKWKIWAVSPDAREGSGYYLFENRSDAELREKFARRYYWKKGMLFPRCCIHEVLENCSRYTRAPLDIPANPPATASQVNAIMHPKLDNPVVMLIKKRKLMKGVE